MERIYIHRALKVKRDYIVKGVGENTWRYSLNAVQLFQAIPLAKTEMAEFAAAFLMFVSSANSFVY